MELGSGAGGGGRSRLKLTDRLTLGGRPSVRRAVTVPVGLASNYYIESKHEVVTAAPCQSEFVHAAATRASDRRTHTSSRGKTNHEECKNQKDKMTVTALSRRASRRARGWVTETGKEGKSEKVWNSECNLPIVIFDLGVLAGVGHLASLSLHVEHQGVQRDAAAE